VFPEIDYTRVDKIKGMNINMTTLCDPYFEQGLPAACKQLASPALV